MGRYFEYRDCDIEDMCNSLIRKLIDAKIHNPLPPKVKKHAVVIRFKTGECCFSFPSYGWMTKLPEFKSYDDAERFLNRTTGLFKMGANFWVDEGETRSYPTSDGPKVLYHYEIQEYDYEGFEDGNYYTEYTPEEIKHMEETLAIIDKARVYMRAFDYAEDESTFGKGAYSKTLNEYLKNYEEIDFENIEELAADVDYYYED